MTTINTWLTGSWNTGREPVELPDSEGAGTQTAPLPATPPPASFGPAVVFGQSTPAPTIPSYGPPGHPASQPIDTTAAVDRLIAAIERPGRISTLDPAFWIPLSDIWPDGSRQLAFHEVALLDYEAWTVSLARELGVSYERYSQEIEAERLRQVALNAQESDWSGGSYSFTLDPSPRVSAPSISPTMMGMLIEQHQGALRFLFDGQPIAPTTASGMPMAYDAAQARSILDTLGYELREIRPASVTGGPQPDGSILVQGTSPRYELVPKAGLSGPFTAGNGFTQIGSPSLPFGGIFMSEDDRLIAQSDRVVLATYNTEEELLAAAEAIAEGAASRIGRMGANTGIEYGVVIMRQGNRLIAYTIGGDRDSVALSQLTAALTRKDPSLRPLWLVHNHPLDVSASNPDLRNAQRMRDLYPGEFQGIFIGKPDGTTERWYSHELPAWIF